jgi:hypothetical protein
VRIDRLLIVLAVRHWANTIVNQTCATAEVGDDLVEAAEVEAEHLEMREGTQQKTLIGS